MTWRGSLVAAVLLTGAVLGCAFGYAPQAIAQAAGSQPTAGAADVSNLVAPTPAPAIAPNAIVQQPRAFGHVLGDVFTQRVLLELDGRDFEPAELPSTGRLGVWFDRRAVSVERDASGRRWLHIDYQLMNSPQALRVVTLPAWRLKAANGSQERGAASQGSGQQSGGGQRPRERSAAELRVAAWPISVAPLTPERPLSQPGLGSLRPDRAVPLISLAPIQLRVSIGIAGVLLTAFAWAGWLLWRNWRASTSQPFARALRDMRGLDGTAPEAWHALHRAFDATAGRAIRTETLPDLFQRAPHLSPLRAQVERFFHESSARFFAGSPRAGSLSAQALAKELRRIEKRHER